MVFDLRRALLAKEERESARLMEFEFLLRARALRLLAHRLGRDPDALVRLVSTGDDDVVIDRLQPDHPDLDLPLLLARARREAKCRLVEEQGDPAPHPLA